MCRRAAFCSKEEAPILLPRRAGQKRGINFSPCREFESGTVSPGTTELVRLPRKKTRPPEREDQSRSTSSGHYEDGFLSFSLL